MELPEDLRYTKEHEWIRDEGGGRFRVGITDHAQQQLGDVVYVELPEVGATVAANRPLGEVESTKSVSDVFAPVSGTVIERNAALDDHPELVNSAPYGEGWMVVIQGSDPPEFAELLSAQEYRAFVEGGE